MYSSATEVATMLQRPLTAAETAKVELLLRYAAVRLRQEVPQLDARLLTATLDPQAVAQVSTAMVHRVMVNPDGRRQGSETAGPFQESWTIDQALSSGALYLSDAERSSLLPPATSFGIGTIRLGHAL